jgi:hypothetical protein
MAPLSLNKRIIYVTGLPRAGSTLLCQLLGQHSHIYSLDHADGVLPGGFPAEVFFNLMDEMLLYLEPQE